MGLKTMIAASAVTLAAGGLALAATPAHAATPLPPYPSTTTLDLGSPNCVTDDVIMNDPLDSTSPITDTYGSADGVLSQTPGPVHYYLWYLSTGTPPWVLDPPPGTQINPTTGVISAYNGALAAGSTTGTAPNSEIVGGPPATGSVTYTVRDHGKDALGAVGTEQFQLTVNNSGGTPPVVTVSFEGNTFNNANGALTIRLNSGSTTSTSLTLAAIASSLNIPEVGGVGSTPVTFALYGSNPGWTFNGSTDVLTGTDAADPEFTATTADHDVVFFTLSGISATSGGVFYINTDATPCVGGTPAVTPVPTPTPTGTPTSTPAPVHGVVGEISSFADYSWSCLDNSNFTWAAGNPLQLWQCGAGGGADQQFSLATVSGHQVLEAIAPAGKPQGPWCVTDAGAGARLVIEPCTGTGGQVISKQGPYYVFADGNVMNDAGWYTGNGAGVIAWQMVGTRNERWSLP